MPSLAPVVHAAGPFMGVAEPQDAFPDAAVGTASYVAPTITWNGNLLAGAHATITYQVPTNAGGNGQLHNVVTSDNPGSNCSAGSTNDGCATAQSVTVAAPPPSTPASTVPTPDELPATGQSTHHTLLLAGLTVLLGLAIAVGTRRPVSRNSKLRATV